MWMLAWCPWVGPTRPSVVLLTPCSHVRSVPVLFHLSVLPIGHTPGRASDFTDTFGPSHPSFLLTDKKEDIAIPPAVVMPTPSKRGRKSKQMMGRVSGVLPPGSDALILAHLTAGGQVRLAVCVCVRVCACLHVYSPDSQHATILLSQHHAADPYDLSNDEDDHTNKDGPKSYR